MEWIQKWNQWSEGSEYRQFYWMMYFLLALSSYLCQVHNDTYCNQKAEWIRIFHHLVFPGVYLGWLAPIQDIFYVLPIFIVAMITWITTDNYCFLTLWENRLCKRKKVERFHDLTYYGLYSMREGLRNIRVYYILIVVAITCLRLYEYQTREEFKVKK